MTGKLSAKNGKHYLRNMSEEKIQQWCPFCKEKTEHSHIKEEKVLRESLSGIREIEEYEAITCLKCKTTQEKL